MAPKKSACELSDDERQQLRALLIEFEETKTAESGFKVVEFYGERQFEIPLEVSAYMTAASHGKPYLGDVKKWEERHGLRSMEDGAAAAYDDRMYLFLRESVPIEKWNLSDFNFAIERNAKLGQPIPFEFVLGIATAPSRGRPKVKRYDSLAKAHVRLAEVQAMLNERPLSGKAKNWLKKWRPSLVEEAFRKERENGLSVGKARRAVADAIKQQPSYVKKWVAHVERSRNGEKAPPPRIDARDLEELVTNFTLSKHDAALLDELREELLNDVRKELFWS